MIDFYAVEKEVLSKLMAANVAPLFYDNAKEVPSKPYIKPEFSMISSRNVGLAPGAKVFVFRLSAKIVVESKTFNKLAVDKASSIAGVFPFGMPAIDVGGRKLRVMEEPSLGASYPTDSAFVQVLNVIFQLTGR